MIIYSAIRYSNHIHIWSSLRNQSTCRRLSSCSSAYQEISASLYDGVVPKIGLEVHAQLKLNSKLFSRGSTRQSRPNTELDLLDLAIPGSLPKLNRDAIRSAILTSIGLNCSISDRIHFDRKNYFYYDMPAGYQITQHDRPIAFNGSISFITHTYQKNIISHNQPYDLVRYLFFESRKQKSNFEPYERTSRIKQIQLEQDSAKSYHNTDNDDQTETLCLVDYNRCGTSLLEIVFEPDLTNHHEASSLVRELISILRCLDTCDCQLAEGSLRVDANVSLERVPDFDVSQCQKVELKNLNSIGYVNRALMAEIKRQTEIIRNGDIVAQETRFFDPKNEITKPLRLKEDSTDYRYVPEPNIPPLTIETELIDKISSELPTRMPEKIKRDLIVNYKVDLEFVAGLMQEHGLSEYYMRLMDMTPDYEPNLIADFLIYTCSNLKDLTGAHKSMNFEPDGQFLTYVPPETMSTILGMIIDEEINFTIAFEVVKIMFTTSRDSTPREIVETMEWFQINKGEEVRDLCLQLIRDMKNVPRKYKKRGSIKDLRMMLDKLLELTNGRINVKRAIYWLNEILKPPIIPPTF